MTYQELLTQLDEIKKEYCPYATSPRPVQDSDLSNFCGCAICQLTESLLISEIQGYPPITDVPDETTKGNDDESGNSATNQMYQSGL